jgi:hypothetical protein
MQKSPRQSGHGNSITAQAFVTLADPVFSRDDKNYLAAHPFGIGLMRSCFGADCKDRSSIRLVIGHTTMG